MKIAIIVPMAEEREYYLEKFPLDEKITIGPKEFDRFKLGNHEIYIGLSGIGKANAATTIASLLAVVDIDLVFVTGSAGALSKDVHLNDLVLATELAYYDADSTQSGNYVIGQIPQEPAIFDTKNLFLTMFEDYLNSKNISYHRGLILTGDSFVAKEATKDQIRRDFPNGLGVEMEGAAFAQVARQFDKPIIILRAISDNGDEQAGFDFDKFVKEAGKRAANMIVEFLNSNEL